MLSILMPVYNERERVERAITAVLRTELPSEFELIVVDDGSTDGTRDLLRSRDWDERVRLLEHPVNRGKGATVRSALADARGELTAIFDGYTSHSFLYVLGNRSVRLACNLLFNV